MFNCIFQRKLCLARYLVRFIYEMKIGFWNMEQLLYFKRHNKNNGIKQSSIHISLHPYSKSRFHNFHEVYHGHLEGRSFENFGKIYLKEPICSSCSICPSAVLVKIYWNWMCSLELSRNLAVNIFNNNSEGRITRMVRDITLNYFIMFVDIVI